MDFKRYTFEDYSPFHCFRPLTVSSGGVRRVVGCYHCPACESKRMSDYRKQIELEAFQSKYVYFLTLTYKPDALPLAYIEQDSLVTDEGEIIFPDKFDMKRFSKESVLDSAREVARYSFLPSGLDTLAYLKKTDFQKFIKRLRKYVSERFSSTKVRFFAIGEYGPKSLRPHFHCLIFTDSEDVFKSGCLVANPDDPKSYRNAPLREIWPHGRVHGELSSGTCANYVSSYVVSIGRLPLVLQTRGFRPFVLHSSHFGHPKTYDLCSIYMDPCLSDYSLRESASDRFGTVIPGIGKEGESVFVPYPDSFFDFLFPMLPYTHDLEQSQIYRLYGLFGASSIFKGIKTGTGKLNLSAFSRLLADIYFLRQEDFTSFLVSHVRQDDSSVYAFRQIFELIKSYPLLRYVPPSVDDVPDMSESVSSVFLRLLVVSRNVMSHAASINVSLRDYVNKIFAYRKTNELVRLSNFYRAQEWWFNIMQKPLSDLRYFYDLEFSQSECDTYIVKSPAKVDFLRCCSVGVYDSQLNIVKMLNNEHNPKLSDNFFVQLYCLSDRNYQNWCKNVKHKNDIRMKHKVINDIMLSHFSKS